MKKIIAFILSFVMLFLLCGCKSEDSKQGNTSDETQTAITSKEDTNSNQVSSNVDTASKNNQDNSSKQNTSTSSKEEATSKTSSTTKDTSKTDDTASKTVATSSSKKPTSSAQATSSNKNNSSQSSTDEETIVIDYNTTVEVDLCDDIIRGYLDADDPRTQYYFLSEYDTMVLDHQNLSLTWKPDGSSTYTLYIAEKADFSDAYVTQIQGTYDSGNLTSSKVNTICYPGKTYYWKVLGQYNDQARGGGKIYVKDEPVRWIKLDGVSNVRDMGGWKTESGKIINYGKIYRGSSFKDITDSGIKTLKALGVKTDIDIRSTASWDSHGAVPSTGLKYYFIDTNVHYDYVFGNDKKPAAEVKENYPQIFELLADESNYPIYLHCNYGNDRTGSMAFIMNGLLGVNYEDLTRDYELTSYAFSHDRRWRGNGTGGTFGPNDLIQNNISNSDVDGRWGMMNKAFMESKYCTDGKLSTAIENFLLDAGVKQEHIDAYKQIMLG